MDSYGPICFAGNFSETSILALDAPGGLPGDGEALGLAMMTYKFWPAGCELRIGFQSGSKWQKDQVKKYAPEWCQHANIKLSFVDSEKLDILIAFDPNLGCWSRIGTDCLQYSSRNLPSMNLGWINETKSEDNIHYIILHEFGHALGAVHEHSSPYSQISWNKEKVYQDLSGPPHYWDREKVDQNVFQHHTLPSVQATKFDPDSVMLYNFPASWTTDGKGTGYNTKLSASDKAFAKTCYPADSINTGFISGVLGALGFR
ncbi:small nuclear ribonucleoprotein Sm D3 [Hypoxylon texense]